jgi:hypothetical protein
VKVREQRGNSEVTLDDWRGPSSGEREQTIEELEARKEALEAS